jgi:hypothetical protein
MTGRMPFGKHHGIPLAELPDDYLSWLLTIELRGWLHEAAHAEYARRLFIGHGREEDRTPAASPSIRVRPEDVPLARSVFDAGYRSLAQSLHPDHGGDPDQMRQLNGLAQSFREQLAALGGAK